ncbi:flagellar basal body rod protein FlgC [bacterium]|nr:flagellar basal body rod protein FlgC [bacterium]
MAFDRLFSVFRVSGSGLAAQRRLIDATASNIANIDTTETAAGGPYVPRRVTFGEKPVEVLFAREMSDAMRGIELQQDSIRHFDKRGMEEDMGVGGNDPALSGVDAQIVMEQTNPFKKVYEPENPSADAEGYVLKPNVNSVEEMTNLMTASRSYEANISILNAAKAMMKKALEI